MEKVYELKGLDLKLYQLKIKYQKDIFIFETIIGDITYKKELKLNDFDKINEYYSSFKNPTNFFKQHLRKLSNEEIEIKKENKTVKVWLIPDLENSVIKKEIILEPQELKEENEIKSENNNDNFKIKIIKVYPKETNKSSEKHLIEDIIKKNSQIYFKDDKEFLKHFFIEELNKSISNKNKLMDIIIISFEFLLQFYRVIDKNLVDYEGEYISLYEYISNRKNSEKNNNLTLFFCYGKIFDKNQDIFVILNEFNKIIFVNDEENIIPEEYENQFIFLSFLELKNFDENHIFYRTTKATKIHRQNINEQINCKILIKLNSIDYNNTNIFNKIKIKCTNEIIKEINNKIMYISFYEPNYSQEYFPQKIELSSENIIYNFVLLIIKGYCNEINLFLNIYGGFAYEYYFISKKKDFLPTSLEVNINNGKKYKSNELWSYETTNRKKITFMNIPKQDGIEEKVNNKNNFLKIYVNQENKKIEYGTFLLDNLEMHQKQEIKIDKEFDIFTKNIVDDVKQIFKNKTKAFSLYNKYLAKHNENFDTELKDDYRLYYFPNNEELFNYFNRLCIWTILLKEKVKNWYGFLSKYFKLFDEINDSNLNFSEKIVLLITVTRRALETELHLFPKIKFFDKENINTDAYTKAFYFHLDLLDSLKEDSKLMIPILQLNSYIMDKILTEEEKNLIKNAKIKIIDNSKIKENEKKELKNEIDKENWLFRSAYTISMLPINVVKSHLKKTMVPYCLIYGLYSKRDFLASIKKDNNIICFNEEQIAGDFFFGNCSDEPKDEYMTIFYKPKNIDDYAFIINLLFLHENSSHNKEKLINIIADSPNIYLDEHYNSNIFVHQNYIDQGEAGYLVESFIGPRKIINNLIDPSNSLGELLKVEYFNQNNFDDLLGKYSLLIKTENDYSNLSTYYPLEDKKINLEPQIYLMHYDLYMHQRNAL